MKFARIARILAICALAWLPSLSFGTPPPRRGVQWPEAFRERTRSLATAFTTRRAFIGMTQRIQANRAALTRGDLDIEAARAAGGLAVSGTKSIPVLTAKFNNTSADPFATSDLQTELFDGPWPTGTMTQYYQEISYGQLTVTGTVYPWKQLPSADTFYEGGCNGLCGASKVGDFLEQTLDLNDAAIDFSQHDNDGPDGIPNSGDDDGYVDFVAFVHAETGGECGTSNIWSHRWVYSGWGAGEYSTNDARNGGGNIKVDDYVIMPGLACGGANMIEIGVFAHEFGHAFGLPDLYDTDPDNGDSEGIGNWCLMAGGGWGGDSASPELPTHMSAWSKYFLGWVNPTEVTSDLNPAAIDDAEDNAEAFKMPISTTEYYLIENRQKKKFDQDLPGAGLVIYRVNETVVNAGLANNSVNADESNKGVDVEEADGNNDLDNATNRADGGDVFPGSSNKRSFDNASSPASAGTVAVCAISDSGASMGANLLVSSGRCGSGTTDCSGASIAASSASTSQAGLLLLLPIGIALYWIVLDKRRLGERAMR
jgi:M6 family metalloprotease-like protein